MVDIQTVSNPYRQNRDQRLQSLISQPQQVSNPYRQNRDDGTTFSASGHVAVSNPYRQNRDCRIWGCLTVPRERFQTLIGRIETRKQRLNTALQTDRFQTLIGRIETETDVLGAVRFAVVSNPYRQNRDSASPTAIDYGQSGFKPLQVEQRLDLGE